MYTKNLIKFLLNAFFALMVGIFGLSGCAGKKTAVLSDELNIVRAPESPAILKIVTRDAATTDSVSIVQINSDTTRQYGPYPTFPVNARILALEADLMELKNSLNTETDGFDDIIDISYYEMYKYALSLCLRYKDYSSAIEEFAVLLHHFPGNFLASNCQYWIAESYYAQGKYPEAIRAYRKVFEYRNQNKADDAQLKLGFCYLSLGQKEKAAESFQYFINRYPDSEFKQIAVDSLEKLGKG